MQDPQDKGQKMIAIGILLLLKRLGLMREVILLWNSLGLYMLVLLYPFRNLHFVVNNSITKRDFDITINSKKNQTSYKIEWKLLYTKFPTNYIYLFTNFTDEVIGGIY